MANKGSSLATNQVFEHGDFLVSPNAVYKAIMQDDGNFVVYQGATVIWASGLPPAGVSGPYRAVMQADGNFVVSEVTGTVVLWASGVVPGLVKVPTTL